MKYDYTKVVNFFYGKNIDKLNDVFEMILSNDYIMLDVNVQSKMILLEKKDLKYIMLKQKERILIIPDNFRSVCLTDDFGEILEISINSDENINISKIFNVSSPRGVGAVTSTWHYENGLYNEIVGRTMFIEYDKLNNFFNNESLDMFLSKYFEIRNDILKDLFWDLTAFTKNNFIDVKFSERIMISDGYNKDNFNVLYKKHIDKSIEVINEKGKSSLF